MGKLYKVIVSNDLYIIKTTVNAPDIKEAQKIARAKFCRKFKSFDNIKVQLDKSDLKNHIGELMDLLYKGGDE